MENKINHNIMNEIRSISSKDKTKIKYNKKSRSDFTIDKTKTELKKETEKWLEKIEKEVKHYHLSDTDNKEHQRMLKNIHAYISDTCHFMKKNDMIRAFECVIWSWAWLEILKDLGILKRK